MNSKTRIQDEADNARRTKGAAKRKGRVAANGAALLFGIGAVIYTAFAQQPVLTIAPLGTNQFNVIIISNAVISTNYTLFWTPILGDAAYPWQVLGVGTVGQTNFTVDGGEWDVGFFEVMEGEDRDGDGVPDWKDSNPNDPNVGQLQVLIYSPAHGSTINN